MKKILLAAIPVLAIGIFISLELKKDSFEEAYEEEYEEEGEQGPGYFKFIREIKGDAPKNIVNLWAQQIRQYKKSGLVLDSIRELGPYNVGGRTRGFIIDQDNPDKIFLGGISGGIWVSEQAGTDWHPLNEQEITLNVSHMAQNPFNPDIIYYSTGESIGNSSAAPGAGIFKSTDHGKTFTQLASTVGGTFDPSWRIVCSLTDTNTVFVSLNSGGVYRSKDAGQSWERVVITSRPCQDLEVFPDGSVMVTIQNQGIYKSPNGDDGSWTLLGNGAPSGSSNGRIELAYCETQPQTVYAAVSNNSNTGLNGVYRSNDGGNSWAKTAKSPTQSDGQYPFTWYCLALDVKRDDPESVLIGSVNLLFTENGGDTWFKANNSHADYHVMAEHPSRPDKIWIGNDGGFHQYDWNDLSTFVDLNWGLNITQFYTGSFSPEGLTVMAGAQDNGTHFTLNAKDSFYKAQGADGSYNQISQQDPSLAYVSFQNGRIYRVDNFGTTKLTLTDIVQDMDLDGDKQVDDGAWFIHPFDINMQDGEMVFYPTKKKVYRSNNGGILFDPITKDINIGTGIVPFCVGISNQKNPAVYIGGSNSLFTRIPNAGTAVPGDEVNLRSFVPNALYSSFMGCIKVNPIDPSKLYVSYVNYSSTSRIWRVDDADSDEPKFVDISGNLPTSMPVNWVEVDPASPDSVIFAGTDRGLFYTNDGGQNWYQEEGIPNVVVDMLRIRQSDRRLFIYTHGRGIFTARITPYNKAIPDHDIVGINPMPVQAVKAYPNPVKDFVTLEWTSNPGQAKTIQVFNAEGKAVLNAKLESGARIDTRNWKPGIYFIKGEGLETKKLQVR